MVSPMMRNDSSDIRRHLEWRADHKRLAAEKNHMVHTVSVDYAFFGEHDQKAKLVLILRDSKSRWTETIPVQSKDGQNLRFAKSVADKVRRTMLQRLSFKSNQEPSVFLHVQFRQLEARSELTNWRLNSQSAQ